MKTDLYTKTVLTVIALALAGLLFLQINSPATAQSQNGGKFQYVQHVEGFRFFDTNTGNIFVYRSTTGRLVTQHKLVELGKPLERVK